MHLAYRTKGTQQWTRAGSYMLPWHDLAAAGQAGRLHPSQFLPSEAVPSPLGHAASSGTPLGRAWI
jgi:hypothetical protein